MAELLFVLVTVYVTYVVTSAFSGSQKKEEPVKKVKKEFAVKGVNQSVKAIVQKDSPVKPKAKRKVKVKTSAKAKGASAYLRHPETGEVVKIANTYRMTKRWIKEALVEEGLLEKIYKINEIEDVTEEKIKVGLDKLGKMKKYQ